MEMSFLLLSTNDVSMKANHCPTFPGSSLSANLHVESWTTADSKGWFTNQSHKLLFFFAYMRANDANKVLLVILMSVGVYSVSVA